MQEVKWIHGLGKLGAKAYVTGTFVILTIKDQFFYFVETHQF